MLWSRKGNDIPLTCTSAIAEMHFAFGSRNPLPSGMGSVKNQLLLVPQPQPQPQPAPLNQLNQFEQRVFELTNLERQKQGLRPLQIDLELSRVARLKSQDMHDNGYFAHNSPAYGSPFEMTRRFGIAFQVAGENIAAGQRTPEDVVRAWMNSPGHRANILNPRYTHFGSGYFTGQNGYRHYWTQMFVGR